MLIKHKKLLKTIGTVQSFVLPTHAPILSQKDGKALTNQTEKSTAKSYLSFATYPSISLVSSTHSSLLAKTGVATISTLIAVSLLILCLLFIYRDYRRHKKPLTAVDPNVHYTLLHHIKVVTIPLFKYRMSIKVSKTNNQDPDGIHKF